MQIDAERIRAALNAQRDELTERLAGLDPRTTHREEPLSAEFSEQAMELEDQEVLDALGDETRSELRQINHALLRLDQGRYGVCDRCGSAIGGERLAVLAQATRCVRCAS